MLMEKEILHALWLNSDETVLLKQITLREKSTPRSSLKDVLHMQIITTRRLFFVKCFYRTRTVQILDSFYFEKIVEVKVSMQHYGYTKHPLFNIGITKRPLLSIRTRDNSYDLKLQVVRFKSFVNGLVEYIRMTNPEVIVSISYKRNDIVEAYTEAMFEGVPQNRRKAYYIVILLVIIAAVFAYGRLIVFVRTFNQN